MLHCYLRTSLILPIPGKMEDLRLRKQRGVEIHRFFGLPIEHQKGRDLLHQVPSPSVVAFQKRLISTGSPRKRPYGSVAAAAASIWTGLRGAKGSKATSTLVLRRVRCQVPTT